MTTFAAPTQAALDVSARGVTKRFGRTNALRGIDIDVPAGQRLAVFGPNGSGKTTLLRILAGLSSPTKGEVRIGRHTYAKHARKLRERIGVVAHHTYLYDDLTAEENLIFYARMFCIDEPENAAAEALMRAGVFERRRDRVRTFSRGMQQRVALARATLHDPDVLFMDEPDTGLDQEASNRIGDFLVSAAGERRTVLVATHNLRLGLRLCHRFVILHRGRLVHEGDASNVTIDELEALYHDATGA